MNDDAPLPHAPRDWEENGLPYGALCKCCRCGLVARSTVTFDYYAAGTGDPLTCESCRVGVPYSAVEPLMDKLEREGYFDER